MKAVIDKCSAYEGIETCGSCESGFKPTEDKMTCVVDEPNTTPSKGSLFNFSFVFVLIALIIAWINLIYLIML